MMLFVLRVVQPKARYAWLIAASGATAAFLGVALWLAQMPFQLSLSWQPKALFPAPILFSADKISWALSFSVAALTLAVVFAAARRPLLINSLSWAGALLLGGLGILATAADNPLALLLAWAALDLAELIVQLRSARRKKDSEQISLSFLIRAFGIALVLWAYIESLAGGGNVLFDSISPNAKIYLILAAGLRLGVMPLHLPFAADSALRRGFGTMLRLVVAAATLSVLGRVQISATTFSPLWILLASVAALYGGWMWLRASDELNGRPYWVIGMAALSVMAALNGNPVGAIAWSCALVLVGGALFLSSAQDPRLKYALLVGGWTLSSLPLSLTASVWNGAFNLFAIFALVAQALLIAGYLRHALRGGLETLDGQPSWAKAVYSAGIVVLLAAQLLLGFVGWDGAFKFGNLLLALPASILALLLFGASKRFRLFAPMRAQWSGGEGEKINNLYQWLGSLYGGLTQSLRFVAELLEGESGVMWALLFLILFISILARDI